MGDLVAMVVSNVTVILMKERERGVEELVAMVVSKVTVMMRRDGRAASYGSIQGCSKVEEKEGSQVYGGGRVEDLMMQLNGVGVVGWGWGCYPRDG